MSRRYYGLGLLLMGIFFLASCANAPKAEQKELNFFPEQADLYLHINVPAFRKLGKALAKDWDKDQKKALSKGMQFTRHVAFYKDEATLMMRAMGTYPQSMVLKELMKSPELTQVDTYTFRMNEPVTNIPKQGETFFDIHIPKSGIMYLSNHLERELKSMQTRSEPNFSPYVRSSFLSTKNAVIYLPDFSKFLQQYMDSTPLPVSIHGLLMSIEPKGSKYQIEALILFSDNAQERRMLMAQSRFISSAFANNKVMQDLSFSEIEEGVLFTFSIKHKDLVNLLSRKKS
ncbi:hypothetical protein [Entomospira culicis]|uniref:Lipoprotein n=1 Tax=Entomospira culicis TaxID=2719989 RepID=A0A968KV14_9SPIO|nr:hypothetical protein [Entomospira culicis]NIZ19400.1 hypothetical protein [Entomospira culicis]NIZ69695.1 hypothetical protein [Entomospira culicis]WDI36805.1 hypothetical protein PVA46_05625 [Entomospira culicis]WDI38434.1 hypothetical protein PVA47_05635 [Entomospira culicis]